MTRNNFDHHDKCEFFHESYDVISRLVNREFDDVKVRKVIMEKINKCLKCKYTFLELAERRIDVRIYGSETRVETIKIAQELGSKVIVLDDRHDIFAVLGKMSQSVFVISPKGAGLILDIEELLGRSEIESKEYSLMETNQISNNVCISTYLIAKKV